MDDDISYDKTEDDVELRIKIIEKEAQVRFGPADDAGYVMKKVSENEN